LPTDVNTAVVGDFEKLIMHRLVARQIRRDPSLPERAKTVQARMSEQYEGWPFVAEWDALLEMPPAELRAKLISRDREMVRLRNSSPFFSRKASISATMIVASASSEPRDGRSWPRPVGNDGFSISFRNRTKPSTARPEVRPFTRD
jgi:hypothetical protein